MQLLYMRNSPWFPHFDNPKALLYNESLGVARMVGGQS